MARLRGVAASAILLAVLMAGCSDAKEYAPLAPAKPLPPPTTTETLHLSDRSRLATSEPTGPVVPLEVVSVSSATDPTHNGDTMWNFTWPADTRSMSGTAVLVVSVEGLVLNDPQAAAQGKACFWRFQILAVDGDPFVDEGATTTVCIDEPSTVPTGVRTLEIPFELREATYRQGFSVQVSLLYIASAVAPGAKVELLTGAPEQDSTVRFTGIAWPLGLDDVP